MSEKLTYDHFRRFENFSENILREIIRDGDSAMQARLQTANSADQRGLNILGFQVAALAASVGGIFALLKALPVDKTVICIALLFAVGLLAAIVFTYHSIFPKKFAFPGNRPDSWFVEEWHDPPSSEQAADIKVALSEQCYCLYSALYDNEKVMEGNARDLKAGMALMLLAAVSSALFSGLVICARII